MKKIVSKKYLYPILTIILLAIIGFQAYFDIQLRKTNGAIVTHITVIEKFISDQFPTQMAEFNKKQEALSANPAVK